jgi:hypothetical protein
VAIDTGNILTIFISYNNLFFLHHKGLPVFA